MIHSGGSEGGVGEINWAWRAVRLRMTNLGGTERHIQTANQVWGGGEIEDVEF